ncbi:MAG: nuclear transport factor 2 family protein [Phycisphaerales bacterium JB050]
MPQTADTDAITKLVHDYIKAAQTGDEALMRTVFHADSTICGYVGPDLFSAPIEDFYEWNRGNGPAPDVREKIASIDIAHTIASVRVELENWTGHRFTDCFNLLKIDGKWWVMSKVFHMHE